MEMVDILKDFNYKDKLATLIEHHLPAEKSIGLNFMLWLANESMAGTMDAMTSKTVAVLKDDLEKDPNFECIKDIYSLIHLSLLCQHGSSADWYMPVFNEWLELDQKLLPKMNE